MQMYEVVLKQLNTGTELTIHVKVDEAEISENIFISSKIKEQEITSSNSNYLSAYQEFRDKLLAAGYGIKCNGSRLNIVQSAMMGATDRAYIVEMGKQALMKDVVHIWDYADIDTFADTKQQNNFLERWSKG